MESNEVLDKLPRHLMSLVIDQPYNTYTAQDHAIWRYVMRQNVHYLGRVAHGSYVDGLQRTGISIDYIPHMYGMNRILKEIGWAAVAVDGFIPPAAFMAFQAYNVLVIAAEIRPANQIAYTPAPDIIHEAAGHAPIIADPEYAAYLRVFGEIGSKAFSSARDYELYEAIRHLSILKADPYTSQDDIDKALAHLSYLENNMGTPSEMARIRNLHWWTVEYGLIGDLENPRIYGAGLLSSIGESFRALQPEVKKIPYSLEAAEVGFDITTMQPQLFVTPDFATLMDVLEQFADGMALRRGGLYGCLQAVESGATATLVLSSGLEVSGVFSVVIPWEDEPAYIQVAGQVMMSWSNKALVGEGPDTYPEGLLSPLGRPHGAEKPLEAMNREELQYLGIIPGHRAALTWPSGIVLEGIVEQIVFHENIPVMIRWADAILKFEGRELGAQPGGHITQLIGDQITSAYPGPADPEAYGLAYPVPEEKTHKIIYTESDRRLHALYADVRQYLEGNTQIDPVAVWHQLQSEFPGDWLAAMELLEAVLQHPQYARLSEEIRQHLSHLQEKDPALQTLIRNGFNLLQINS